MRGLHVTRNGRFWRLSDVRTANLVVSGLAVAAVVLAAVVAWRGRRLERIPVTDPPATPGEAALTAVRTLGIGLSAGIAAGFLVVGLGGRLVMRVLAATSGDRAQGRTTEAEELVGEITVDGTIGFILFVGLGGGVVASLLYLLTRRVLPRAAGPAGLVLGVLLVGTLGVQDPLSPDNRDFAILEPLWLAVALIVATALLFGATFTAVAARLEARAAAGRLSPAVSFLPALLLVVPTLALLMLLYVGGCALLRGRAAAALATPAPLLASRVLLGVAVVATGTFVAGASIEILG
jgi:hypothetical protein